MSSADVVWSAGVVLVGYALPALYHVFWAGSVRFLSFGERVTGRAIADGTKVWLNPYHRTRTTLYLCMVWALSLRIVTTPADPVPWAASVAGDALFFGLAVVSMILLGRGWSWGLLGLVAYRMWETTSEATPVLSPHGFFALSAAHVITVYGPTIALAIVCIIVARDYSVRRESESALASIPPRSFRPSASST